MGAVRWQSGRGELDAQQRRVEQKLRKHQERFVGATEEPNINTQNRQKLTRENQLTMKFLPGALCINRDLETNNPMAILTFS